MRKSPCNSARKTFQEGVPNIPQFEGPELGESRGGGVSALKGFLSWTGGV